MSVEKDIRYELLARLCPNSTGKSVCNQLINGRTGTVKKKKPVCVRK